MFRMRLDRVPRVGLALAMLCVPLASARAVPAGAWSAFAPPLGGDGVGCYDTFRHRFVQFDGEHHAWALDTAGDSTWTQLTFTGEPPRLTGASAIYDPAGDRMIVFGGIETHDDQFSAWSARVLALNFAGATPSWTELLPSGTPPGARAFHSAVYDPNGQRMIVFGGATEPGPLRKDVWSLSLGATPAWSQISMTGGPAAREQHVAAFDAAHNTMFVHGGGIGGTCDFKDLWSLTFSGTPTWHFLVPLGQPTPCTVDQGAVFDPVLGELLVTGRQAGVPQRIVWEVQFSGSNATWVNASTHGLSGLLPDATNSPTVALDTQRLRLLVNGGGPARAGMFALSMGSWRWDPLGPPESPSGERWMATLTDPATGAPLRVSNHALWRFDLAAGGRWRRMPVTGPPNDSAYTACAVVDRGRGRIVTFGGYSPQLGAWFSNVRMLPLDGVGGWSELSTSGQVPKARQDCSAVYDSLRDRILVYGGYGLGGGTDPTVYSLSLADGVWSELSVSGTPPVGRNSGQVMLYDPPRDRALLMLGGVVGFNEWQDCWALHLTDPPSWERLSVSGTPPPSMGRSAVYDPVRDRVLLAGSPESGGGGQLDALSLGSAPAWTTLATHADGAGPDAPVLYGMDAAGDRLLSLPGAWQFPFGNPTSATVLCPGDMVWWPGQTRSVAYAVTNPEAGEQFADWTLSSTRAWPGFPIQGSMLVPALSGVDIVVPVPIPDTLASGQAELRMDVVLRASGATPVCSHHVHDLSTAALGTLSDVTLAPDALVLTWEAPGATGQRANVERSDDGSAWRRFGVAAEVGSGTFRFADSSARRGAGYYYRLVSDATRALTAVTFVSVPERAAFALHAQGANPSSDGWSVALDVPSAGEARVELYDLAGRRLVARTVHAEQAGRKLVPLPAGERFAAGVYTVIARFAGEQRSLRLVLYR